MMLPQPIKLLALIEATTVTGPVKNLLEFARLAREAEPSVETTLATYVRDGSASNQFIAAAQELGIEVRVMKESSRWDREVLAQMKRIAAQLRPDIIQTHSVKSHFLVRLSGLWRRSAWVAFHHGYTATDWKVRCYNQLDRWSLRRPNGIVTMNQSFARELRRSGVAQHRLTILHNAIRSDWLHDVNANHPQALRHELGIAANDRMILSVGRLSHEKAHIDLVTAIAQLAQTNPPFTPKLVIVGEGPERKQIARTAASLGIKLVLMGQQKEVHRFYAAADVFALPSHSEGSPNVLLEAMAAALPIVATAVGGVPEIVTADESALLVRPRNTKALAEALARILSSKSLATRLAANARGIALARHSTEARVKSLLELYRQLASATPQGSYPLALQGEK